MDLQAKSFYRRLGTIQLLRRNIAFPSRFSDLLCLGGARSSSPETSSPSGNDFELAVTETCIKAGYEID